MDDIKRKKIKRSLRRVKRRAVTKKEAVKDKAKKAVVGEQPDDTPPPKVTTKTVAEHRKEILGGAKRFIYPLTHSKHRIAIISISLFVLIVLIIFGGTAALLYRYQSTNDFAYQVSQIIPYPISKVDGSFVPYEEYLFEVRQSTHFYAAQENINFEDEEGKAILANIKIEALARVKENALARKLAKDFGIELSDDDVTEQIDMIRQDGGIGDSDEALENTLQQYYGWSISDFERVIGLQLLKQKLVPFIDEEANGKRDALKTDFENGLSFEDMVTKHSDDRLTKENAGKLGLIGRENADLPETFLETAFALKKGEVSQIVESDLGYHVIKRLGKKGEKIEISHILIQFSDISDLIKARLEQVETTDYITVNDPTQDPQGTESRPQSDDLR